MNPLFNKMIKDPMLYAKVRSLHKSKKQDEINDLLHKVAFSKTPKAILELEEAICRKIPRDSLESGIDLSKRVLRGEVYLCVAPPFCELQTKYSFLMLFEERPEITIPSSYCIETAYPNNVWLNSRNKPLLEFIGPGYEEAREEVGKNNLGKIIDEIVSKNTKTLLYKIKERDAGYSPTEEYADGKMVTAEGERIADIFLKKD